MGNHKEMTMTEIVSGAVDTLRQQAKFGAPITQEYPGIADVLEELAARNDVLRADLAEARGGLWKTRTALRGQHRPSCKCVRCEDYDAEATQAAARTQNGEVSDG